MGGDSSIILYLQQSLGGRILDSHAFRGDETIVITREGLLEVFRLLKEDPKLDFNFLTDITAVDYLGKKEPRFEVVYHFYSFQAKHRLRVKVGVPEEDPIVDSLVPLWKEANWLEREVWDMFGIRFLGHPDLTRILLYKEFQGPNSDRDSTDGIVPENRRSFFYFHVHPLFLFSISSRVIAYVGLTVVYPFLRK